MKPRPQASMQRAMVSGAHSILTPSAVSTSAEPERDEIERLPCLATGTPAPATTKAAQVEMLYVPLASPPVPQVSIDPSGARTGVARALSARAAPAISSTVSPLTRIPISSALICASVARPDMIRSKASAASAWVRLCPEATLAMALLRSAVPEVSASAGLEDTGCFSVRRAPRTPLDTRKVEEIGKQLMAMLRGDALRVELHPMHRVALVLEAHDHPVSRLSRNLEGIGEREPLDDERMIARR